MRAARRSKRGVLRVLVHVKVTQMSRRRSSAHLQFLTSSPINKKCLAGESAGIAKAFWNQLITRLAVLCCPKCVRSHFSALCVEIAVKRIHGSLKHEAAVRAAFEMTFDLALDDRREASL